MSTRLYPTIDFSTFPESDGEPMAETLENQIQMFELMVAFRRLFADRGVTRVTVGGNQLLYYNPANGREHCSPDVYVALDVEPGGRRTWKTWLEEKCPDVVFEITSASTVHVDLEEKPQLYARLGAREYYIYDPQQELEPPLRGFVLAEGRAAPLALGGGGQSIESPLLGVELRIVGQYMRLIDPGTGQPYPTVEEREQLQQAAEAALGETEAALSATETALSETAAALSATETALSGAVAAWATAEQARIAAEQAHIAAENARVAAEQRAAHEERARYDAESRAALAEARLQEALARLSGLEPPRDAGA